jgi:hypothetical protein
MPLSSHYPSLFQINTRVWLTQLSKTVGRGATLDDIPDMELDRLAAMGFEWIWFLSEWRLEDLVGDEVYDREGGELQSRGLYVDMPPWKASVFSVSRRAAHSTISSGQNEVRKEATPGAA